MEKMPALFLAHGSPFNLTEKNKFTNDLKQAGKMLQRPKAIIVISAHWLTRGTQITSNQKLEQIYDFYGFPKALYDVKYEPPANPQIAQEISSKILSSQITLSNEWGLDHAATIVLINLFPNADIPVLELSVDIHQPPIYHFNLGKVLESFRQEGILFVGSGNMIHTFREINWNQYAEPFDWAIEYDNLQKNALLSGDFHSLIHFENWSLSQRAFQTNDHYFPMLYILGMQDSNESLSFIHEGFQHGSMSHRSFRIG